MVDCIRWNYPTDIRYGCGGISQLGSLCEELAVSNPLFVTDTDLVELGMTKDAIQCYRDTSTNRDIGTNIGIFSANVSWSIIVIIKVNNWTLIYK